MNYSSLPSYSSDRNAPVPADQLRGVDLPYRGGEAPDSGEAQSTIRAMLVRGVNLAIKYRLLIVAFAVAGLLIGFIVTFMTPKVYSAVTTIKIDRSVPKVVNAQGPVAELDTQSLVTQFELIRSRAMAERVAAALNLAQTTFPGPIPAGGMDAATFQQRNASSVWQIMGGLQVQHVPFSSIVRIRYSNLDPQWAQRISVAVAEQFERWTLDNRFNTTRYTRNFLEERLTEARVRLQDAEKKLIDYAEKNGIVNVGAKESHVLTEFSAIQGTLTQTTTDRLMKEQLWQIAQSGNDSALPQVMSDKGIQESRARLAGVRAMYQEKLAVLKPAFPEMVTLRAQIVEVEKQIRDQIDLVKMSIKAEYDAAKAQELTLIEKLEEVKNQVLEMRNRSVDYTILQRESDTSRALYDGLLQQLREVTVAAEVDVNNVSIVDRALIPGVPDGPSLRRNLMISLLLSFLGAAGVIGLREVLDDTFKTTQDVEETLRLPVLGVTPLYLAQGSESKGPFEELTTDPTSPLAEAYRSLRTALQFSTERGAPRTLLVTSARPGEGKSTTALALAVKFSQLGLPVLLIDADLRNPSAHRVLGLDNETGVSNYLAGVVDVTKLIKETQLENVKVMTSGPLPPNPAELLAGARFGTLLSLAAENFSIVIVDGPPIMGLADAPIISSVTEGTLIVVEAASTRRALAKDALRRMEFARAHVLGVVLTKFDPHRAGHTYGYGYTYSYGYGAGYGPGVGQDAKKSIAGV